MRTNIGSLNKVSEIQSLEYSIK